jgi:hypothetical protein
MLSLINFRFKKYRIITVSVIVFVVGIVYGVSHADFGIPTPIPDPAQSWTGIYGVVTSMSGSGDSLILDDSAGSKYPGVDIFTVDLRNVQTVEYTNDHPVPIALTDINAGDKIIARGIIDGSDLTAYDLISFSYVPAVPATSTDATSTATSTATTTDIVATSTTSSVEATTTTSTSTATSTATTTDIVITATSTEIMATSTPILVPPPATTTAAETPAPSEATTTN